MLIVLKHTNCPLTFISNFMKLVKKYRNLLNLTLSQTTAYISLHHKVLLKFDYITSQCLNLALAQASA